MRYAEVTIWHLRPALADGSPNPALPAAGWAADFTIDTDHNYSQARMRRQRCGWACHQSACVVRFSYLFIIA
jgi:hypothetical protein